MVEIRVPTLGESVSEATIGRWLKNAGDEVTADEALVELETEKVALEVNAPASGVLTEVAAKEGDTVAPGALLGKITEGQEPPAPRPVVAAAPSAAKPAAPLAAATEEKRATPVAAAAAERPAAPPAPSAAKIAREQEIDLAGVAGTGKRGQVLKGDVLALAARAQPEKARAEPSTAPAQAPPQARAPVPSEAPREERVRMTRLRQTIARRLKEAQNTAAMLTTFNEVDMSSLINLRNRYKDLFEKKHSVKLGFMGFFVKACCHALEEIPAVNAEIDGTDIVYKHYCHIGVAVGSDKGLVVPVVRDADRLSIAEIEKAIGDFAQRAREGRLDIAELTGGTFTISNGGIYGSLMSTPILNPPQSGILGMHKIEERPVVVAGKIEIHAMMYLALSYDHRVVDGKDAVTFLVRVKEALEDPARLVLDL